MQNKYDIRWFTPFSLVDAQVFCSCERYNTLAYFVWHPFKYLRSVAKTKIPPENRRGL